jgi:pSer/pThr/pTyr-binding forkhead associated (FHA) protein/outer membrane protein assembly factor BamB
MKLEPVPAAQNKDTMSLREEEESESGPLDDTTSRTLEKSSQYLVGIYGSYLGRKFRLKSSITRIGRDQKLNDVVVATNSDGQLDKSVSRRQASIRYKDGRYYLLDKRSQSRTALNRRKIAPDEHLPLEAGDEIEIESDKKNHIFRMVENGNWDFAFPRKSGSWHVRNRDLIIRLGAAAVITVASLVFVQAFRSASVISSTPGKLTGENIVWHNTLKTTTSNGPVVPATFPATADLNDDGYTDLLFVDGSGKLTCFGGRSRTVLWTANDFQAQIAQPVTIGDLRNDRQADVVVISNDFRVRAIDGKLGLEIWKSPILPGPLTGPAIVADLNGDALNDVAVAAADKALYVGYSETRNARWQKINLPDAPSAVLSAADFDGDGMASIVVGTRAGLLLVVNCLAEKIVAEINVGEELSKATGQYFRNNRIVGPPGIADLNGDAIPDLIAVTGAGHMLALNGSSMQRLWYNADQKHTPSGWNFAPMALGDFDGDKQADVAAITPDGRIQVLKGQGQGGDRKMILWETPAEDNITLTGVPVVADFNKNGGDDIIVTDSRGRLIILDGANGKTLLQQSPGKQPLKSLPLIADFNNDNALDLLTLGSDGRFHLLNTNRKIPASSVVWGQAFANSQHTLLASFTEPKGNKYYGYMAASLCAILAAVGIPILFKRSRRRLTDYT